MQGYQKTLAILEQARELAERHHHEYLMLEHVAAFLLNDEEIIQILDNMEVDADRLQADILDYLGNDTDIPVSVQPPKKTVMLERSLQNARMQALFNHSKTIEPLWLLFGIIHEEMSECVRIMQDHGLTRESLIGYFQSGGRRPKDEEDETNDEYEIEFEGQMEERSSKSTLAKHSVLLNQSVQKSPPIIGRDKEIEELIQTTARMMKPNVILTGPAGVGKTAIVEGFVQKIVRGEVPERLEKAQVYSLDIGSLLAGTRFRGDLEERVHKILKEVKSDPDAILFIDEIHTIVGAGSSSKSNSDIVNLLKPALSRGEIRVIGATTDAEYKKCIQADKALARRFFRVHVDQPNVADTKLILRGIKQNFERHYSIKIPVKQLDYLVDLSARYLPDRPFPDKAVDLLDAACAYLLTDPNAKKLTDSAIRKKLTDMCGVEVTDDPVVGVRSLTERIRDVVIGQDSAIKPLCDAVKVSAAGLRSPGKPQLVALLQGPTGTGKTLFAKTLASSLGVPLVRFDMSEYSSPTGKARLMGSDPGYVGYRDGGAGSGLLAMAIEKNPQSVLLFDEIEKAHPDIFTLFLQMFDEGRATMSDGEVVRFDNTWILMTTNLGARDQEMSDARTPIGFGREPEVTSDVSDKAVQEFFAPEFRNRIDLTAKFVHLSGDSSKTIIERELNNLVLSLKSKKIKLKIDPSVIEGLRKHGFDKAMGARPLARCIQEKIKVPLSEIILSGDKKSVVLSYDGEFRVE